MGMRIEFLPVYFLLASVLTVGGVFGLDYVQDRLEPQSGAVVAKSYVAPKGGLVGSRGEVYRFEISDGSKKAVVSVPESVWEQAEVGDWYDKETATLAKADGDVDGEDAQHEKGADPADG